MDLSNCDAPVINTPWVGQGGIYVGLRLCDGILQHVITPSGIEHDVVNQPGDAVGKTSFGVIEGHSDWQVGEQEDYMLAHINCKERFAINVRDSIYWTRTLRGGWRIAVGFASGECFDTLGHYKFRLRPFRYVNANLVEKDAV